MKRSIITLLSIVVFFTFMGFDCDNDNLYQNPKLFEVAIEIDSLGTLTGDTLWMHIEIPSNQLTDRISGNLVTLDNATFYLQFELATFTTDDTVFLANRFEFAPGSGSMISAHHYEHISHLEIKFGCPSDNYNLDFGIVFNSPGVYAINLLPPGYQIIYYGRDRDCYEENYNDQWAEMYFTIANENIHFEDYEALIHNRNTGLAPYVVNESVEDERIYFVKIE